VSFVAWVVVGVTGRAQGDSNSSAELSGTSINSAQQHNEHPANKSGTANLLHNSQLLSSS
jgi:hypothetical protein